MNQRSTFVTAPEMERRSWAVVCGHLSPQIILVWAAQPA